MNLKLWLAATCLFLLAGCTHSVRGASPASDLDALQATVSQEIKPQTLPSGKEYCAEHAKTEDAQDKCLGDLEDLVYLLNRSMERGAKLLEQGLDRIRSERITCGWLDFSCRKKKRTLDATLK